MELIDLQDLDFRSKLFFASFFIMFITQLKLISIDYSRSTRPNSLNNRTIFFFVIAILKVKTFPKYDLFFSYIR